MEQCVCLHVLCVFPRGMDAPRLSHARLEPWLRLPMLLSLFFFLPPLPLPTQPAGLLKHPNTHTLERYLMGGQTE